MKTTKTVLVATVNNRVIQEIINCFENDSEFSIIMLFNRNKLVSQCLQTIPDVIIIENLFIENGSSEFTSEMIITTLRCFDELKNSKILFLGEKTDEITLKSLDVDDYLEIGSINQQNMRQKILSLINTSLHLQDSANRRKWPRANVDIPTQIELFLSDTMSTVHSKNGIIKDISLGGVCLLHEEQLNLLLQENSRIELIADTYPLKNWQSVSQIIRSHENVFGMSFLEISDINSNKIKDFFQA